MDVSTTNHARAVKVSLVLLLFGRVETGLLFMALPKDYLPELNSWQQGKPRSA
jgi:hypothetical protein